MRRLRSRLSNGTLLYYHLLPFSWSNILLSAYALMLNRIRDRILYLEIQCKIQSVQLLFQVVIVSCKDTLIGKSYLEGD